MKFEIGRNKLSAIIPSATHGNFIVNTRAQSPRIAKYILIRGLSAESTELLNENPHEILDLFDLSDSGLFTLKREENPQITLSANVRCNDSPVYTPIKLASFVEVIPITPANVHATLPL
ncbi:MAG: hypothetical protein QG628_173 [Patescibacteria group bacterium]|jgi:hypothetical protein|nr:hypothetical protein [Patescibacteria group bacterium]